MGLIIISEKGNVHQRLRVGNVLAQLGKDNLRDEWQIERTRVVEWYPLQVRKLILGPAEIVRVCHKICCVSKKEPRVKAPGSTPRGDGPKEELKRTRVRDVTRLRKAAPAFGCAIPRARETEYLPSFLPQLSDCCGCQTRR